MLIAILVLSSISVVLWSIQTVAVIYSVISDEKEKREARKRASEKKERED